MSIQPNDMNETRSAEKKTGWKAQSGSFVLDIMQPDFFGISESDVPQLIEILKDEGLEDVKPDSPAQTLKFIDVLVKYFGIKDSSLINLRQPIARLLKSGYSKGLIESFQLTLLKFLDPFPPFKVVVDGVWGQQTQNALLRITNNYNLVAKEPSKTLLDVLDTLALRIIRLDCQDQDLMRIFPYGPFMMINTEARKFKLITENNSGIIINSENQKRLAEMPDVITNRHLEQPGVNTLGAWLMMLEMGKNKTDVEKFNLSVSLDNTVWIPLKQIKISNQENEFTGTKLPHIDFTQEWPNFRMRFLQEDENINLVGVCLNSHLQFVTGLGYRNQTMTDGMKEILFDFEGFYDYKGSNPGTYPRLLQENADLFKIFIVRETQQPKIEFQNPFRNPPGIDASIGFYEFIARPESDILGCITIELGLGNKQPDFKARVKKIYEQTPIKVADDLQKGRWGGESRRDGIALSARISRHSLPGLYNIELTINRILSGKILGGIAASADESSQFSLKGEVAFFLHDSFAEPIRYELFKRGSAKLKLTAYEAFTVGAMTEDGIMLELDLNELTGAPNGFHYNDVSESYKSKVEEMYKSNTIRVKDDLQKGRWGGQSANNGLILSAEVTKSLIPRFHKVTIKISTDKKRKAFAGDVAIFLHDSFPNQIRYQKAINREVAITVNAYEAFTVGAFASDGTMLELDLNKVKGYPQSFYY